MKSYRNRISKFNKHNPASLFFEFGLSPDEIKSSIKEILHPFFTNTINLEQNLIPNLYNTWMSFLTLQRDKPELTRFINTILEIYNQAKTTDKDATFEAIISWLPDINDSISRYWSLYNSEKSKDKLCLEDYLEEHLRIIGQTIEGISKPFIKLLLHLHKIRKKKAVEYDAIRTLDLGIVIDELINSAGLGDLLITGSKQIRLNQWRNIAYHHNSKVINNTIVCWYKKGGINQEFIVSKSELTEVTRSIFSIFKLLRISETIFSIDNITDIRSIINQNGDNHLEERNESQLLDFHSAIASQGFRVLSVVTTKSKATLKIEDMIEYSHYLERGIHSSQFLYNLWLFSDSEKLSVEYHIFGGDKFLVSEISSSSFVTLNNQTKLADLLIKCDFSFLETKFSQDTNPFFTDDLLNNHNSSNIRFKSQQGKTITTKEFVRQFTLTVFSNYLVFISEGFESKDISINIGKDGSLAIASNKAGKAVFHSPAVITDELLQSIIMNKLKSVIELYHSNQLHIDLVEEAKFSNKFLFKKQLIKEQVKNR